MSAKIPSAAEDFYLHVNQKWLTDPENEIPPEYPRWGGFTTLMDEGLKKQIALVKSLVPTGESGGEISESEKIAAIWHASVQRFNSWKDGTANLSAIRSEFDTLESMLSTCNDNPANSLAKYFWYTQQNGISNVLDLDKGSDLSNSNNVLLDVCICGLSLPSRDFYFEPQFEGKRKAYLEHLKAVEKLVWAGKEELTNQSIGWAEMVLQFETVMAYFAMKPAQSRDYTKYFTRTTLTSLWKDINGLNTLDEKESNYMNGPENLNGLVIDELCMSNLDKANFQLSADQVESAGLFFEELYRLADLRRVLSENREKHYDSNDPNAPDDEAIACYDGDGFRRVVAFLTDPCQTSLRRDMYKAYMQYKIISTNRSTSTQELDELFFDFYGRTLSGQEAQKPEEKRSIGVVNACAGEMMGKVFVEKYFPEHCKEEMLNLVNKVLDVMQVSIKSNDWLTEVTKEKALEKLSLFRVKIGYPDEWKDYSDLDIKMGDSLAQIRAELCKWSLKNTFLAKINAPLDREEWRMTPQTVNAYFMPTQNEIVFPAAILQPPFFHQSRETIDFDLSDEHGLFKSLGWDESQNSPQGEFDPLLTAVNLGGIGAVIAHEITHGYDDNGRKFDGYGNVQEWWTPEDAELFKDKTGLMTEQVEAYEVELPSTDGDNGTEKCHMNAQLTMGENLADLGGLGVSVSALTSLLQENYGLVELSSTVIQVYHRIFFKSFANIWKCLAKPDFRKTRLSTDPHAPPEFRGNLVKNMDEFHAAFNVKPGDSMYLAPEKRLRMW